MTEEDEEQFRRESMPRTYTLRQRWADYRAEVRANRPKGAKARVRAWLHVEPFYWGMRAAYVVLVVGAVFAVYINGVANGWWHAWGEKPTVAATTTPTARPVPSASSPTEAAMSGGYQIGPDGVLVRPAEHAASTYTKPELPEEAKENTERGAELAAEHAFSLLIYAWNTGDTQPFADITQSGDGFRETYIDKVKKSYASGWTYGMHSSITRIVKVEPVSEQKWGAQPNTIGVQFKTVTSNGVTCVNQKISTDESEYRSSVTLFMTWKNEHWVVTDGDISNDK
ncbi:DUF6318 family protein [Pauljensenia sp. 20925_1_25]|uniref:DUF6318 family protein n=1 Tax=Pauljensenia sp. 20925_1_25 TaxID=3003692 RepID=UPI00352D55EF